MTPIHVRASIAETFWKHSKPVASGCREWQRSIHSSGYGQLRFRGKVRKAHQVAFILARGKLPLGMCVLHHCDNRLCVNPDHLFLGTHDDNMNDMRTKGRSLMQRQRKLFCVHGHALVGKNIWWRKFPNRTGPTRSCRECMRAQNQKRHQKQVA